MPTPRLPTHFGLHSVPIAVEDLPADIAAMFHGMALYDSGTISVAFRETMVMRQIVRGDRVWSNIAMLVEPGTKVRFEFVREKDWGGI